MDFITHKDIKDINKYYQFCLEHKNCVIKDKNEWTDTLKELIDELNINVNYFNNVCINYYKNKTIKNYREDQDKYSEVILHFVVQNPSLSFSSPSSLRSKEEGSEEKGRVKIVMKENKNSKPYFKLNLESGDMLFISKNSNFSFDPESKEKKYINTRKLYYDIYRGDFFVISFKKLKV